MCAAQRKKPSGSKRRAFVFVLAFPIPCSLLPIPCLYAVTVTLESTFTGVSQPNRSGFSPLTMP